MSKERRMKTLQNIGIITLVLISMFYINELFGSQLRVFRSAVNSIILPFGIALFMSYLLQPLVTLLEEKLKIKKLFYDYVISVPSKYVTEREYENTSFVYIKNELADQYYAQDIGWIRTYDNFQSYFF